MQFLEAYERYKYLRLINARMSEKTIKEYETRMRGKNGFITVVGNQNLAEITQDTVMQWKLHLRNEGVSATYINHNLSALKCILEWTISQGNYTLDPNQIVYDKKEQNKPQVVLSDEEVDRIIAATTSQRDKAILELFYATGCRSAELIDMDRQQWEAVELVDPEYMIWQIWVIGKNRKYRPVCLHNRAKVAVDRYLKTRTDCFRPLFISGQRGRITYSTVDKMLKSAAERAEITKRVSQHTLRHSYATKMASNGMPVPTLSYNLGHANGTVTQRVYVHINSFQAAKSYARCQNES